MSRGCRHILESVQTRGSNAGDCRGLPPIHADFGSLCRPNGATVGALNISGPSGALTPWGLAPKSYLRCTENGTRLSPLGAASWPSSVPYRKEGAWLPRTASWDRSSRRRTR